MMMIVIMIIIISIMIVDSNSKFPNNNFFQNDPLGGDAKKTVFFGNFSQMGTNAYVPKVPKNYDFFTFQVPT